ncbi:serine/threonine-protein kinase [Anaeramoeba flamelloides]|uniref:Serine/threonine-protein kinase n=1 Tax=Anaeramoeba flamelloides TaxID=1746091 RepID=A0AAV7YG72_9EUKA|nr:serine/threonine-protein kinase [Anaeramoeba flamelloides]
MDSELLYYSAANGKITKKLLTALTKSDNTTPFLNFKNYQTVAKVVDVYDGDTVKVVMPVFKTQTFRFSVRISRIDCPEIRPKTKDVLKKKIEKEFAIEIREYTKKLLLNKYVRLDCKGLDKYGRLLAEIYFTYGEKRDVNFSDHLINKRMAVLYDGGTKVKDVCLALGRVSLREEKK